MKEGKRRHIGMEPAGVRPLPPDSSASSPGAPGASSAFLYQSTPPSPLSLGPSTGPCVPGSVGVKQCAGCNGNILDRFLLYALDRYWHTACLKCSLCQVQLEEVGRSCFTRAGMILCKADYIKLFGLTGSCAGCGQSIPPSDLVLKVQESVYHVHCFTCSTCHHRLVAGDRFRFVDGNIVCEQDYAKVMRSALQQSNHRTRHKVC